MVLCLKVFLILWLLNSSFCLNTHFDNSINDAYYYIATKYGSNGTLTTKQINQFLQKINSPELISENLQYLSSSASNVQDDEISTQINSTFFSTICSSVLAQIEHDGYYICNSNSNTDTDVTDEEILSKPDASAIWGFGFLSVTIISLCSLVGISILPLMKSEMYDKILLFLIALAVGTLSSNGIFQLIPEGFGIDSNPMTVWQSAVIFGGFYVFYLTESLLERIFDTSHSHGESAYNDKDQDSSLKSPSNKAVSANKMNGNYENIPPQQSREILLKLPVDNDMVLSSDSDQSTAVTLHPATVVAAKQKQCWIFKNYRSIKTVAWMITVADGMHNFIDGLAIGASFSMSMVQGVSTSLAIFCEEFPHELGDFAILISSGMTMKQAAFYNFASACCCYIGLVVGILVGNDLASAQWIFALAGGVFLYISLAGMLPEAQAHCSKKGLKQSPWLCLFIKNLGLLCGFTIMFLLTIYKDRIKI